MLSANIVHTEILMGLLGWLWECWEPEMRAIKYTKQTNMCWYIYAYVF